MSSAQAALVLATEDLLVTFLLPVTAAFILIVTIDD